jgi:hypothetical protein
LPEICIRQCVKCPKCEVDFEAEPETKLVLDADTPPPGRTAEAVRSTTAATGADSAARRRRAPPPACISIMTQKEAHMTPEQAEAIWDILVEHAGASPSESPRQQFVFHQTRSNPGADYRFQGLLSFGGKFWVNDDRWYINCYREDERPERLAIIEKVNGLLAKLKARKPGKKKGGGK